MTIIIYLSLSYLLFFLFDKIIVTYNGKESILDMETLKER